MPDSKKGIIQKVGSGVGTALKSFGNWAWGTSLAPQPVNPMDYRGQTGNMMWAFGMGANGCDVAFTYGGASSLTRAYKCPPVSAIINNKAQAYTNGKIALVSTSGQKKGKEASGYDNVKRLLKHPNYIQNWKDFEAQGYVYKQLQGYNVILIIKPSGITSNQDAYALWNIPPTMLCIKEYKKYFYQKDIKGAIESISLLYDGYETPLNLDDVFIMRDYIPSFYGSVLPGSRISGIEYPIANVIGAYESRHSLINYRGARGILSNSAKDTVGHIPLPDGEKETINGQFREYGLRAGQSQFIITSANLQWQQIGQATKDLMLFEEVDNSTMAICDAFGYPYRLLSAEKSASYNDVREFKGMLYTDTIIPEAESDTEQWNELFGLNDLNVEIIKDFSGLAVLQADRTESGRALMYENQAMLIQFQNNLITQNQWLEFINQPLKTDGDGDKYYYQLVAEGKEFGKQQSSNNQNNNDGNTGQGQQTNGG